VFLEKLLLWCCGLEIQGLPKHCVREILGVCFVTPAPPETPIFGFAQFITAFSFLALVYTVSDVRYKFRIAAAPIPIVGATYVLSGLIGVGTLLTSAWFALQWPVPDFLSNQVLWQAAFAMIFFGLAMTWVWYAFLGRTRYTRRNYKRFAQALYFYILKGSETELPIIAAELQRYGASIVRLSDEGGRGRPAPRKPRAPGAAEYAHDIILLIANRKFCRHIVASSPSTAIVFFQSMTDLKKYYLPISQFAVNISNEALTNKDSILYHEDEGYHSGLLGYVKPFSKSLYGDFELVESLASFDKSPLDIDYRLPWSWDAKQAEAYCRATLITLEKLFLQGTLVSPLVFPLSSAGRDRG
jgi:hypothetical protein